METLHYRAREILERLLYAHSPLLIRDLASTFSVSERTIKYDLEKIRELIKNRELRLESKPNKGIWVEGNREQFITQIYGKEIQKNAGVWSGVERQWVMTLNLLLTNSYITIQELADLSGISRNTAYKSLSEIEELLSSWQIKLKRIAHKGLKIEGNELAIRAAMFYGIQNFLKQNDLTELLHGLLYEKQLSPRINQLLSSLLLEQGEAEQIYRWLRKLLKKEEFIKKGYLSEQNLLRLLIILCVVIQRVRSGNILSEQVISSSSSYLAIQKELKQLVKQIKIDIPKSEVSYIWAQGFTSSESGFADKEHKMMSQITLALIQEVSEATAILFQEDPILYENLLAHLKERVAKYSHGVLVPNPLKDEIIRTYGEMFTSVKKASDQILGAQGIFLNHADLAYITLHFQTSYEKNFGRNWHKCLVICGTGRGSASLLQTRLENEIKNITIIGCCSVFEVSKALEICQPDIIISVLPVETHVPTVVVEAILTEKDIQEIQKTLKLLGETNRGNQAKPVKERDFFKELLLQNRSQISPRDLPFAEALSQEVINQGFQIATRLSKEFREYLTEEAMVGLTIHVLHMVNRIAFDNPYVGLGMDDEPIPQFLQFTQVKLLELLQEYYPDITDSEMRTILRYFSKKEVEHSHENSD